VCVLRPARAWAREPECLQIPGSPLHGAGIWSPRAWGTLDPGWGTLCPSSEAAGAQRSRRRSASRSVSSSLPGFRPQQRQETAQAQAHGPAWADLFPACHNRMLTCVGFCRVAARRNPCTGGRTLLPWLTCRWGGKGAGTKGVNQNARES